MAAAVALANLRLLDEGGLVAQVEHHTGPYFQQCLRERFAGHPLVGEIQGSGAVAAVQLSPDGSNKARFANEMAAGNLCTRKAWEQGLIVRATAARIILAPALIAGRREIDELIDKLGRAVDQSAVALKLM